MKSSETTTQTSNPRRAQVDNDFSKRLQDGEVLKHWLHPKQRILQTY